MKHCILVFSALFAIILAFGAFVAQGNETFALTEKELSIGIGEKSDLYSLIGDEDKDEVIYTFKSKNDFVASINDRGIVEGRRKGTASIVITKHTFGPDDENGESTEEKIESTADAELKITVKDAPTGVSLSAHNIILTPDESFTLEYGIMGGVSSSNIFDSQNEAVAQISEEGVITAKKTGSTYVSFKTYNGKNDKCKVTVMEKVPEVFITDENDKIQRGSNNHAVAYSFGGDIDDKSAAFSTSDEHILKINSEGKLTGVRTGSATVYLQTVYDNLSASKTYKVVDDALPLNCNSAQIALDYPNVVRKKYGESALRRALEGYIITNRKTGKYEKTLFMDFACHGFEDSYAKDGRKLTEEANALIQYFSDHSEELGNYRLVIVPCVNPDGTIAGKNNLRACSSAYGRCTARHVDINRDFNSFKAIESKKLRDFIISSEASVYLNFHGWLNESMGTKKLCNIINKQQGFRKYIPCCFTKEGYIIGWVNANLKIPCALVEYKGPNSIIKSRDVKMIKEIIKEYR